MMLCQDCAYSVGIDWNGLTQNYLCNAIKITQSEEHNCTEFLNKDGSSRNDIYPVHIDQEFVMIYELLGDLNIPFDYEKTTFSPEDIEEYMKIPEFNVAFFAKKYGPQE
jgi:hypothetical protein